MTAKLLRTWASAIGTGRLKSTNHNANAAPPEPLCSLAWAFFAVLRARDRLDNSPPYWMRVEKRLDWARHPVAVEELP